jgi:hypothetical protein
MPSIKKMVKINLPGIVEQVADYVSHHGRKVPREIYNHGSGSGSDSVSVHSSSSSKDIQGRGYLIVLTNRHIERSSGTYSVEWSKEDSKNLSIYIGGRLMLEARKGLGGVRGHSGVISGSSREQIPTTDWDVKRSCTLKKLTRLLEKRKIIKRI